MRRPDFRFWPTEDKPAVLTMSAVEGRADLAGRRLAPDSGRPSAGTSLSRPSASTRETSLRSGPICFCLPAQRFFGGLPC
jgi:hypothetical protein